MISSDLLFHNTTATTTAAAAVTAAATRILSPLIATTAATLINGYMNSNLVGLNNNFTNSIIQLNNDSQTIINNNNSVGIVGGSGGGGGGGYNGGIIDDNKELYEYYSQLSLCEMKNIYFNCTVEEYLKYVRGPQTLPLSTALSVTIFFLGIFITGILGNVLVCVVIIRNSGMHTATNYYLFSLAVSDLIFLLWGLPYEISLYWHQYPYNLGLGFCKIRALISEASTYVSVLTIVAFSMERFLAICHPLHLYTMSGFKRAVRIIAVLWVVSFLSAVPFGVYTKIDYIVYPLDNSTIQDSAFCAMLENPNGFPLWELSSLVFFAIPMIIIIILYGRMGLRIRSRTQHSAALGVQHGSVHGESRQSQSRRAIIRMLAAVVITFFVCWAPFHAQRLMFLYAYDWEHYKDLNDWLFSVTGWLYYVSCTINPILYNIMSQRYRVAFRETLCGTKRGYYRNNGFCREQSSFRETTITVASNAGYETSHLIRARSMPSSKYSKYCKDRIQNIKETDENITENNCNDTVKWNNDENSTMVTKLPDENATNTAGGVQSAIPTSDVIVVIGNTANGRPKCYAASGGGGGGGGGNGGVGGGAGCVGGGNGDGIRENLLHSDSNDNENFSKKDETCI